MSQTNPDPSQPFVPIGPTGETPEVPTGMTAPSAGTYWAPPPPPAATYWTPPPPPPPPPAPPHRNEPHLWRWIVVSVLVAALAAGGSGVGVGWGLARALRSSPAVHSPIAIQSPAAPSNGTLDTNAIAARVDPAIVDINTVVGTGQAAGTGMILTSDGEVLTNNHVVDGSSSIHVTIAGLSGSYTAHVIGVAPAADVALIQIENVSGLPTVSIGSSAAVQVGDSIVALGNALGQGGTPSGQSEQLTGMIQSDAAISPGDSGGPIVNSSGQVVGMITAGDVQGFRSQTSTVNYAIPSDTAISFVNKIRSGETSSDIIYGQVGFMGVSVRDLSADIAAQLGLKVSSGAVVVGVQAGSPADGAGISQGSVITDVGGTSISNSDSLGTAIHSHKAGDRVSVTWVDQRGTHNGTLTLGGVNP